MVFFFHASPSRHECMVPHLTIERLFSLIGGALLPPFALGFGGWLIRRLPKNGTDGIRCGVGRFFDMEFLRAGRFDSVQIGQTGRRLSAGLSESLDGVYLAVGGFSIRLSFFARSQNLAAVSRIVI
jgi:hypothetical protein